MGGGEDALCSTESPKYKAFFLEKKSFSTCTRAQYLYKTGIILLHGYLYHNQCKALASTVARVEVEHRADPGS